MSIYNLTSQKTGHYGESKTERSLLGKNMYLANNSSESFIWNAVNLKYVLNTFDATKIPNQEHVCYSIPEVQT